MAMSVVYTTVNGQILRENRGGVVSDFVPDPLGSVVMVQDASGAAVYRAEYDPYGNVQSESGTNPSSLGFVGTLGYIKDSATSMYVRARYLLNNIGRWLTKDPLWPSEPGYVYAGAAPSMWVDPSGERVYWGCSKEQMSTIEAMFDLIERFRDRLLNCLNSLCIAPTTPIIIGPPMDDLVNDYINDSLPLEIDCRPGKNCDKRTCAYTNYLAKPPKIVLCGRFWKVGSCPGHCVIAHELIHATGHLHGPEEEPFACVGKMPGCKRFIATHK